MAQLYKLIFGNLIFLLLQYVVAILLKFKINKLAIFRSEQLQNETNISNCKKIIIFNLKSLTRLKMERDNELELSQR